MSQRNVFKDNKESFVTSGSFIGSRTPLPDGAAAINSFSRAQTNPMNTKSLGGNQLQKKSGLIKGEADSLVKLNIRN